MNANKVLPENLLLSPQFEIHLYKPEERPITVGVWFINVNFSKLTDNNQIFRNDFDCIHYHLCKFSTQIVSEFFLLFVNSLLQLTSLWFKLLRKEKHRK